MENESFFEKRFMSVVNSLYDVISDTMILRALEDTKGQKARIKTQPIPFYRSTNKTSTEVFALEEKGIGSDKQPTFTLVLREVDTRHELGYIPNVRCSTAKEPDTIYDALDTLVTFIINRRKKPEYEARLAELQQKRKVNDQEITPEEMIEILFLSIYLQTIECNDLLIAEGYPIDKEPINS